MELSVGLDLVSAVTLVFGLAFAIVQLRQYRAGREREIALELLRSFQTQDFASALRAVYALPMSLSKAEIEERLGPKMDGVYALTTTWESLGVLVFRGQVGLDLVDDFFSGPIRISWAKLQPYFQVEREEQGRETIGEWFQWLAEQMAKREKVVVPTPAHIAHRNWTAAR
jgi:hypothetical protein